MRASTRFKVLSQLRSVIAIVHACKHAVHIDVWQHFYSYTTINVLKEEAHASALYECMSFIANQTIYFYAAGAYLELSLPTVRPVTIPGITSANPDSAIIG